MTPKELAHHYISALNPNLFKIEGVTPEMIADHERELAEQIQDMIESKCRETAKNVRHKAIDILLELHPLGVREVQRNIMNIQFNDVKP